MVTGIINYVRSLIKMKVLAIDTSNLVMGVGMIDGDQVIGEIMTNLKKNHSVRLMPAIEELMNEVNVKPKDLDRIVVAKGPGSYTGVRIGVTTAKTMAWSLNIPIVGVSSLEILAQNGKYFDGYVSPLFDARRGQVYTGLYGVKDGFFQRLKQDQNLLLKDWLSELKKQDHKVLFLGNDVKLHEEMIKDMMGEKAVIGSIPNHIPRPAELAYLGLIKEVESIHSFVPNYIRLAEAEAKWLEARKKQV